MLIDTLLLSACGTKGNIFIGSLLALSEKNIIDFNKIKRYICCSGGAIVGFLLCCGYSLNAIKNISETINYESILDLNDLDNLFEDNGLFSNNKVGKLIEIIIKHKYKKDNLSLIEFYKLTKKRFIIKVFNLSSNREEYISYKNHPNMSIITLIKITTCIPFIFKPIIYNNDYYIDGGITGNMVFNSKYKNYLGIYICNKCQCDISELTFMEYINRIVYNMSEKYDFDIKNNPRIINCNSFSNTINFEVDNDTKNSFIIKSHDITIKHIDKYKL